MTLNNPKMKKIIGLLLIAVITCAAYACKSHEKCPAYGKTNQQHTEARG